MKTSSARQSFAQPGAKRSAGQRFSARLVLVAAWVAFWLNTALFPCCEALAAALVEQSDISSQSAIVAYPPHHSGEAHAGDLPHTHSIPCETNVKPVSAMIGTYAQLPADPFHLELLAIEGSATADLRELVEQSANRAPRNYRPPPPIRIYQQTQRLLI